MEQSNLPYSPVLVLKAILKPGNGIILTSTLWCSLVIQVLMQLKLSPAAASSSKVPANVV